MHITTRIDDHPHESLFRELGGRGFPTMKFLDSDGTDLGDARGRGVEDFESSLKELMVLKNMQTRIANGEKDLEDDVFLIRLGMGLIPFEEAQALAVKFAEKLTPEQNKEVAQLLINGEVNSIMESVDSQEAAHAAGKQFKTMLADGKVPSGDTLGTFWSMIMTVAEEESDIDLFEQALAALKVEFGHVEAARPFFHDKGKVLDGMKEAAKAKTEEEVPVGS